MGPVASGSYHGDLNILENIIIASLSELVFPGTGIIGSDLLESPQQ